MLVGSATTCADVDVLMLLMPAFGLAVKRLNWPVPVGAPATNVSVEGSVVDGTKYVSSSVEFVVVLLVQEGSACPDVADNDRPNCVVEARVPERGASEVGSIGVAVPLVPRELAPTDWAR